MNEFDADTWSALESLMQDVENGDLSDWDVSGFYFPHEVYYGYPEVRLATHAQIMRGEAQPPVSASLV